MNGVHGQGLHSGMALSVLLLSPHETDQTPLRSSGAIAALLAAPCASPQSSRVADREIDRKVEALLTQMTVEEKIGQLTQSFHFVKNAESDQRVVNGEIGAYVWETDPAEINRLQHLAIEESRLHIPLIFMMNVIHGYGVTFPVPIATAGSWDMPMIENEKRMVAKVARNAGLQWAASPVVDIARDPRWGRIIDGAGEDPYLGAKVAVAQTRGYQGTGPVDGDHRVVSLKHFAGYGYSEGGRDHDEALIPESVLRNVVLKPFKAAIDAGAGSVMSAYMDLNDVPATSNHRLLTDVLRSEWGFKGIVVSDNNAVTDLVAHGYAKDQEDAGTRALAAGVDLQMSNFGNVSGLLAARKDGSVNVQELDRSVRRMLKLKYQLGLLDRSYIDRSAAVNFDRQPLLKAARNAPERSAVQLKNADNLLPHRTRGFASTDRTARFALDGVLRQIKRSSPPDGRLVRSDCALRKVRSAAQSGHRRIHKRGPRGIFALRSRISALHEKTGSRAYATWLARSHWLSRFRSPAAHLNLNSHSERNSNENCSHSPRLRCRRPCPGTDSCFRHRQVEDPHRHGAGVGLDL